MTNMLQKRFTNLFILNIERGITNNLKTESVLGKNSLHFKNKKHYFETILCVGTT